MKNFIFIFMAFLVNSCSNENPAQNVNISAVIGVSLENSQGEDLLGSEKYPKANIYADYLINGKIILNTSNAYMPANPNNVYISDGSVKNHSRVLIYLNHAASEKYPITYIHWNETDTDTIKAQYTRSESSVVLSNCWILENGNWKEINSGDITIIK